MKTRLFTFIVMFTQLTAPAFSQCNGTLVWSDEFSGSSLDLSKWTYDGGDGCAIDLCGWGNNELEYYTNSSNNIYTTNGVLTIKAIKESMGNASFTSGKIKTLGLFGHTYGRYEARMRLPQGRGLWPAFWMLNENNSWPMTGEIDIMEYRGDLTDRTNGTLHYGSAWPNNQHDGGTYTLPSGNFYSDWHVFAVEWDDNEIRWFVDGNKFKTETKNPNSLNPASTNDAWPWDEDFYIILNLAVGGWYTETTNSADVTLTKATFEVDYVRVYDMKQTPYSLTPKTIPGKIEAEEFDLSCGDGSYFDTDAVNSGSQFRNQQVDIEACTDAGGGYNIGWTEAGEWLEYTINVPASGLYDFTLRAASGGTGGNMHIDINGTSVSGTMNVSGTGGWQNWQNFTKAGIPLSAGTQVMRVNFESGGVNLNYLNVVPSAVTALYQTSSSSPFDLQVKDGSIAVQDPNSLLKEIRLVDLSGRTITIEQKKSDSQFVIKSDTQKAGIYFIYMLSDQEVWMKKIILN